MPLDPGLGSSSGQQTGTINNNVGQQTGTINNVLTPTDPHENEPEIYTPEGFSAGENETAPGEFVGVFERSGNHVLRSYLVPWEDYFDWVTRYLGYSQYVGGALERRLPYRDYQHRNMVATRVEVRGVGYRGGDVGIQAPLTSGNRYRWARLVVQFSTVPYLLGPLAEELGGDPDGLEHMLGETPDKETTRYCYKEVRPAIEYVTAKPGGFVWEDTGDDIRFPVPQQQSSEDITVTWYDLDENAFPDAAIEACQGKVNSAEIQLPAFPPPVDYAAETLFLQTHTTTLRFSPNGLRACDLTYFFKRRPDGFNKLLDQAGNYRTVKRKGTSTGIFPTADFNRLFTPGD
jgi:hypothetical protein